MPKYSMAVRTKKKQVEKVDGYTILVYDRRGHPLFLVTTRADVEAGLDDATAHFASTHLGRQLETTTERELDGEAIDEIVQDTHVIRSSLCRALTRMSGLKPWDKPWVIGVK